MATFEIPCQCGASLRVSASQAGTEQLCACGRTVTVPRLSELQQKFPAEEDTEECPADRSGCTLVAISAAVLLLVLLSWNHPALMMLVCLAMFVVGKLWFLFVMFCEMGAPAVLVFIIPFFDWCFLFIRFDVAWKPVALQFLSVVVGFVIIIVAGP